MKIQNHKIIVCSLAIGLLASYATAAPKKFASPLVTKKTPNHQIAIEIDITGAKVLFLEVSDGGNGTSYDWADWIEPVLIGPKGSKRLTDLTPATIEGKVKVGLSQGGTPLRVNGKRVKFGIGAHANSNIMYKLPAGYKTFRARGGMGVLRG